MQFKNKIPLMFFLFLGLTLSQRITLPLKSKNSKIFTTVKYGNNQCSIDLIPSIDDCSTVISQTSQEFQKCGAILSDDASYANSREYHAKFNFGDPQADIYFYSPKGRESFFYGENQLCFGFYTGNKQRNTIAELFQNGLLTEERFYVSIINSSTSQPENSSIGKIDIGAPDNSLIKSGKQFVELKQVYRPGVYTFATFTDYTFKFFGKDLDSRGIVFFTLDNPFTQLTSEAFNDILKIFDEQGIQYTYNKQENSVFLPSIEKLKQLSFNLLQNYKNKFNLTVNPSQYTLLHDNGLYQLLITPLPYTEFIYFGYTIFESYYVGFDVPHRMVHITEKSEKEINNLRGNPHISV